MTWLKKLRKKLYQLDSRSHFFSSTLYSVVFAYRSLHFAQEPCFVIFSSQFYYFRIFFFVFFFFKEGQNQSYIVWNNTFIELKQLQLFALKLHFPIYTRQALTETRLKLCGILIMRYIFWKSCRPMLQTSVSEQRNLYRRSRELHVCMWFIGMEWNLLWKR